MTIVPLTGKDVHELFAAAAVAGMRDTLYLAGRFLGAPCLWVDPEERARVALRGDGSDGRSVRDLLATVDEARRGLPVDERGPLGLVVALLGYEAAVALDARAPRHPRDPALGADGIVRVYRAGVRRGPAGAEAFFDGSRMPDALARLLDAPSEEPGDLPPLRLRLPAGARERHEGRVLRCKEQLLDGVLYQANLAHRLRVGAQGFREGALRFLETLRFAPPAFAAFLDDAGWGSLVSRSPECFLEVDLERRRAVSLPIKGTRPRGRSPEEDAALLDELRASRKDAAEHVMIVDLVRNDLGKVAEVGGVSVESLLHVVSVPNVHHLESRVGARLRPGVGLAEILEAVAPGGSITGAPKSAAIEVIHALEEGPRGPYTGSLVVADGRGRASASLLIRTWVRPDAGEGALFVGGGIVWGSEPRAEWQETLDKARAFGVVEDDAE